VIPALEAIVKTGKPTKPEAGATDSGLVASAKISLAPTGFSGHTPEIAPPRRGEEKLPQMKTDAHRWEGGIGIRRL
jgi:hypothetical protein